jgi:hypothetical protein
LCGQFVLPVKLHIRFLLHLMLIWVRNKQVVCWLFFSGSSRRSHSRS